MASKKKLKKKIKKLKWDIVNGIAFAFNMTPDSAKIKCHKRSLDKQLSLLFNQINDFVMTKRVELQKENLLDMGFNYAEMPTKTNKPT